MKYVDIAPLTKEIDSLYDKWCGSSTGLEVAEEGASIDAAESIFGEVRKTIASLQQEMWKPSEEQMEALENAWLEYDGKETSIVLSSLMSDLQKLL